MTLPVFDYTTPAGRSGFQQRLRRLQQTAAAGTEAAQAVARIVQDVRQQGDAAVVRYMQKWTDPDFSEDRIVVPPPQLEAAVSSLSPQLREAIEQSIENVRAYQQHILPAKADPVRIGDAELGLRWTPMDSVGLCVPGGSAVLFSTLIMLAVPAQVAGVPADAISVVNPPPTRQAGEPAGDISPIVLATCHLLGISRVYRIGGAQAVAAMAYGTRQVQPVSFIAGPGNVFVQLAKQQVHGHVGTEGGFYGPSEILTIADQTADADRVAADLIAQAEHDPGKCFLVCWQPDVIGRIQHAVSQQLAQRGRVAAIERALAEESAAILSADPQQAVELANIIAAEHVNLAVAQPGRLLEQIRHGGEFFLGDQTPVAAGDYHAGPSHCLPTATTARFASGVSVYTFLKRSGTVCYPSGMSARTIEQIACMAQAEGLDAHAASAQVRSGGA